jgi:chromate transport protein ChrA
MAARSHRLRARNDNVVFGGYNPAVGAVLGFIGIFLPGIVTVHGTMGIWGAIRGKRWVKSALRGVNAGAVGLIYTAVYRLWQIGYVDQGFEAGKSLGDDPWWVVVGVTSYVGGMWFNVSAPMAIVLGAVMGLIRYGRSFSPLLYNFALSFNNELTDWVLVV